MAKRAILFAPVKVKYEKKKEKKKETSLWETYLPVPWSYRVFSHDVKAAILVSQNNETAAMLVSQTSPVEVEFLSHANAFFCFNKFGQMLHGHVSENTLYRTAFRVDTK